MRLPNGNLVDKVRVDGDYHFSPSELMLYLLNKNQWTSAVWTFVFRKELVMISQACFTKRVAHEDHLFTMRLISASNNIICIPDVIYIQNVTNGSLTNSEKSSSYLFNRFDAFHEVNKDASYEYCLKIKILYYKWSLISFIDLCINNNRSAFGLIFIPTFCVYIFRYSIQTYFVF